jgi:hypothetical protein
MVRAPRTDVVAVTPGTVERATFPPEHIDVGVTLFGAEELMDVGENRHGSASPVVIRSALIPIGDTELFLKFYAATNCDKLSDLVYAPGVPFPVPVSAMLGWFYGPLTPPGGPVPL